LLFYFLAIIGLVSLLQYSFSSTFKIQRNILKCSACRPMQCLVKVHEAKAIGQYLVRCFFFSFLLEDIEKWNTIYDYKVTTSIWFSFFWDSSIFCSVY